MSLVVLVLFMAVMDALFPLMYRYFRFDLNIDEGNLRKIYKKYGYVSFPRTPVLLMAFLLVIFAPMNSADNVSFLSGFVIVMIAYLLCAIRDANKTLASDAS